MAAATNATFLPTRSVNVVRLAGTLVLFSRSPTSKRRLPERDLGAGAAPFMPHYADCLSRRVRINDVWDRLAATGPTLDAGKADFPRGRGGSGESKQNGRCYASPSARRSAEMIDKAPRRGTPRTPPPLVSSLS